MIAVVGWARRSKCFCCCVLLGLPWARIDWDPCPLPESTVEAVLVLAETHCSRLSLRSKGQAPPGKRGFLLPSDFPAALRLPHCPLLGACRRCLPHLLLCLPLIGASHCKQLFISLPQHCVAKGQFWVVTGQPLLSLPTPAPWLPSAGWLGGCAFMWFFCHQGGTGQLAELDEGWLGR